MKPAAPASLAFRLAASVAILRALGVQPALTGEPRTLDQKLERLRRLATFHAIRRETQALLAQSADRSVVVALRGAR